MGPETDGFEADFALTLGAAGALATTTGTSALHLSLRVLGVGPGDDVLVSTLTFCASVNPILYLGARPVFVDSEELSWNVDAAMMAQAIEDRVRRGKPPRAVIVVHLYGQVVDMAPILEVCARHDIPIVEDAAEALGARYHGGGTAVRPAGGIGTVGIFSFDGSKIITTSVGGMLVSDRPELVTHARKLARQAREPVAHYEHEEMGYNYRMSNLLAAVGRVQLRVLGERVAARRQVFEWYAEALRDTPHVALQPEAPWGVHTRWLSCLRLSPEAPMDREGLRLALAAESIECRAVWKPMHLQPLYRRLGLECVNDGLVANRLFAEGLCLPSSSSLRQQDVQRVAEAIHRALTA